MDEQNTVETTVETTAAAEETTAVEKEQATPPVKTFTQDELNAIIDKRLERERKDAQARIDKAVTEAQKLAKMSADERAEHEKQAHEKALADREAEITKRELRAEAKSQLSDKGLPIELAEILPYTDADTTNAAIVATEKVFRLAVEKGVTERLKGNPPKVSQPTPQTPSIDDEIRKAVFGK
ncbi:MAG: DUF4355 domain-containing protein [Candidatus Sumerlaeales bacterium]|nr:DUF4355 domain-containing protein [Candidatus Sumerlaeales bacterium]